MVSVVQPNRWQVQNKHRDFFEDPAILTVAPTPVETQSLAHLGHALVGVEGIRPRSIETGECARMSVGASPGIIASAP
jgi:hypothetical protein